jgi:predicted DNA-binding transcriptional regulator AlpA
MDSRWLSVDEIAEYLGVSKDTVYTWVTSKGWGCPVSVDSLAFFLLVT